MACRGSIPSVRALLLLVTILGMAYASAVAYAVTREPAPPPDLSSIACTATAWFGDRPNSPYTLAQQVRAYRTDIASVTATLRTNLGQFSAGAVRIDNPTWQADLRVSLGAIRRCANLLRSLREAPGPTHPLDATVLHLEQDLTYIEAETAGGLDGQDAGRIANAVAWLDWLPERLARIDTDALLSWYGGQIGTSRLPRPLHP
jgi:hypothetical protein